MNKEFYAGFKDCGCLVCIASKTDGDINELLIEWLEEGLTVKAVSEDELRNKGFGCRCNKDGSTKTAM